MKRYMAILLCTVMAIGFVACQPTPEKEIVVHKAAEQLEATLKAKIRKLTAPLFAQVSWMKKYKCHISSLWRIRILR